MVKLGFVTPDRWGPYLDAMAAVTAKILPVRAMGHMGMGLWHDVLAGMRYAANQGVRIVNLSIGGLQDPDRYVQYPDEWNFQHEVFRDFPEVLFVASAGNDGVDLDQPGRLVLPCEAEADNVICVAASNWADERASFSNYGSQSVDIAAPGDDILLSEWLSNDGTSYAAPLVSAAAAMIAGSRPQLASFSLRQGIVGGADQIPGLESVAMNGWRLNADASAAQLSSLSSWVILAVTRQPEIKSAPVQGAPTDIDAGAWNWSPPQKVAYRWDRCEPGGACRRISGAYSANYRPMLADVGKPLRLVVVAYKNGWSVVGRSQRSVAVAPYKSPGGGGGGGAVPSAPSRSVVTQPAPPRGSTPRRLEIGSTVAVSARSPRIRARCVADDGCYGSLVLAVRGKRIAASEISIAGGRSAWLRFGVTRHGRAYVGRRTVAAAARIELDEQVTRQTLRLQAASKPKQRR